MTKENSYLIGFIWFQRDAGEVHVNLRGYPGETKVPSCNGQPCFSGERGTREVAGTTVDVYTVNHGADTWHVLYAWKDNGSLYSVSQHVVPELGLSYSQVVKYLDRIMAGSVAVVVVGCDASADAELSPPQPTAANDTKTRARKAASAQGNARFTNP